MNPSITAKIGTLRLYLTRLPNTLPLPSANEGYWFDSFTLDKDWEDDIGEEGAVNRELEVRLGSWDKGTVKIKERGPGISTLADVLD